MAELADWFLTAAERGNPATQIPAWCEGNRAEPLIHGATYFDQLATEVEALGEGDYLFFTDWRGDPDQKLRDDGPTIAGAVLRRPPSAASSSRDWCGVRTWTSSPYSEEENQHLGEAIERPAGRCCWTSGSGSAGRIIRSWW